MTDFQVTTQTDSLNPSEISTPEARERMNDPAFTLRRIVLAIMALMALGGLLELLLIEHFKSGTQWIAVALLVMAGLSVAAIALWATPRVLRVFQVVMVLVALGGAIGVWEHLKGNLEVARELTPQAPTTDLLWRAVRKGAPLLAPGVLVQLGLLGLAFTYRHPGFSGQR